MDAQLRRILVKLSDNIDTIAKTMVAIESHLKATTPKEGEVMMVSNDIQPKKNNTKEKKESVNVWYNGDNVARD